MTVEDIYVNADVDAGKMALNLFISGQHPLVLRTSFAINAVDDAGSIYRLFKGLPSNTRIKSVRILNDAIAGATDVDLGFYETEKGQVIDANFLDDAKDLSAAHAVATPLVCMSRLALGDYIKSVYAMLNTTGTIANPASSFDLCLTVNSNPTATGTVVVDMELMPESDY